MNDIMDLSDNNVSLNDVEYISEDNKSNSQYESEYDKDVYTDVFLTLTHKFFDEADAKQLWIKVLDHRATLTSQLNRDPGIVVSCLDYLTNVENLLSDATIIEEGKSQYIVKTNLIDKLTNLFIRAVFDVILEKEFSLSKRNGISMAVLMIDIDDFKLVNDTYGHIKGDKVLNMIGSLINSSVRSMDIASRYGGEEIAIIMPNTEKRTAGLIGERIRRKVYNENFDGCRVTVSVGISCYEEDFESSSDLLSRADSALFSAKSSGKNKVVFFSEDKRNSVIMKRDE